MFKSTISALPLLVLPAIPANAAITAITGTGWNHDLIVEASAIPTANTDAARETAANASTTTAISGWNFYEAGWSSSTQGLNNTGAYSSANASYQMESYVGANTFFNGGTFTPTNAQKFSDLAFLVTTQKTGTYNWTATVNFTDTTSTILSFEGTDWINSGSTGKVIQNHGLVKRSATAGTFYAGGLYIVERIATLSAPDQLKDIQSITFDQGGASNLAVHAISGQVVPEPSATALVGLAGLGFLIRRRR